MNIKGFLSPGHNRLGSSTYNAKLIVVAVLGLITHQVLAQLPQPMEVSIKQMEYEVKWQEQRNAYQSPNRANNFRVTYFENGFAAELRDKRSYIHDWSFGVELSGYNKGQIESPPNFQRFEVDKNAFMAIHDNVIIDYHNSDAGLRQNFLIIESPSGKNGLVLSLVLELDQLFAVLDNDHLGISLFSSVTKDLVLHYWDLNVFDANEKLLKAQFEQIEYNRFNILIDDLNAVYPILVDPLTSGESETGPTGSKFGFSVSAVGKDGQTTGFLIGAPNYDGGQTDEGKVFYYKSNSSSDILPSSATWTNESNVAYAQLGYSVCGKGDMNGDQAYDLVAGAPGWSTGVGQSYGRVLLWVKGQSSYPSTPTKQFVGDQDNCQFGYSVSLNGDVVKSIAGQSNNDLVVGVPYFNTGTPNEYYQGKVYLFAGNNTASSISTNPVWTYSGSQNYEFLGYSVAVAKSVDNHPCDEIMAGAPGWDYYATGAQDGRVLLWYGREPTDVPLGTPSKILYNRLSGERFGHSVSSAGNIDDDTNAAGLDNNDIIIGAPNASNEQSQEGRVYVYHGDGLSSGLPSTPTWKGESNFAGAKFGSSVSYGLINDDTYSDIIVGSPYWELSGGQAEDTGRADVWCGSSNGLGSDGKSDQNSDETLTGFSDGGMLGNSVDGWYIYGYGVSGICAGVPGVAGFVVYQWSSQ